VKSRARRIGLISDTHGLLRRTAVDALRGCELILHAGDVGDPAILATLRGVAPVIAVRGNVDTESWAAALRTAEIIETAGTMLYLLHNERELDFDPGGAGFQMVVSGHSHQPAQEERAGVLYLNPGSAGPARFRLPVTVGRLDLARKPWKMELVELSGGQ
jgi:uncharacterized protein